MIITDLNSDFFTLFSIAFPSKAIDRKWQPFPSPHCIFILQTLKPHQTPQNSTNTQPSNPTMAFLSHPQETHFYSLSQIPSPFPLVHPASETPLSLLLRTPPDKIPLHWHSGRDGRSPTHRAGYEGPESLTMKIGAMFVLDGVNLGDIIGVNETCLTVTEFDTQLSKFTVGFALETLRKTSEHRSLVNLERAFVQGHVDRTRVILGLDPEGDSLWVKVKMTKELIKYMVDVFDDE